MALNCGIVGLPNVGKSTLFSALTRTQVHTDIYPFTTVDPNTGVVAVPDVRLDTLSETLQPEKKIPTTLKIVDIAGLIKGSHHGEGLGNQFLAQIREADAIVHLIRCFESENVTHISQTLDPVRDIEIIETELILKDLETVTNRLEKVAKKVRVGDKAATKEQEVLERLQSNLDQGRTAKSLSLSKEDKEVFRDLFLLTDKPSLYVGNVNEEDITAHHSGTAAGELLAWGKETSELVLILSAALEHELSFLQNEEERTFFMNEWQLQESGLEALVHQTYGLLNLITFFTTESDHVQAWTAPNGTNAPEAAGVIHTDFEKGFIKADVYRCDDLFTHGSEAAVREHGLISTHGKYYTIQDGDVVKFRFKV